MGKHILTGLMLLAIFSLSSCEKEETCYTTVTVDGVIRWSGSYAVDGCGYFLMVGEKKYKPTNEADIPDTYKVTGWEGTPVEVKMIDYNKQVPAGCQVSYQANSAKLLEIRKK
ncbi:hypothetical protein [Pontibacter cellulosilyticus]|uniref:Lipoprotein n=1 Tax=Pontibacter cellulosilyticus TaxID=1720253 RepID=A0A923N535_9BACT|nr:hypothetical protein [Pontibacter cellulosilyticus]MBC5992391.1 hypothetical protein [Pontibacter cellulosilyticus]